jgi:hypothetical protein
MDSSHTAALDNSELSEAASIAHVFPAMANNSLLSVGQLCNEGYYVTFNLDGVTIFNSRGHAILKGVRDWAQDYGASTCARMNLSPQ